MNVLTQQEVNLLKYHISTIKQIMRDIVSYGIRWLKGDERNIQAANIQHLNQVLLRYEHFINMLTPPMTWVDLYKVLLVTGAQPYHDIYDCLNGLERLTNTITNSMNDTCAVVSSPSLPLECASAALKHRQLKGVLLNVAADLFGCHIRTPDTLIYLTYDMLTKIEFYNLKPIDRLGETLKLYGQVCLITRTIGA